MNATMVGPVVENQRADEQRRRLPWGMWGLRTVALGYLAILLLLPLLIIVQDGLRAGVSELWRQATLPVVRHALWLTLWTAGVMTVINTVMGTLTAYALVRYEFRGRALLNALIDLPLAIPSLVTGVMLVILYGPQQAIGGWMKEMLGLSILFTPSAIILALLFVTFPFVVRTIEPVLHTLDRNQEDAAASLGAGDWTIFWRITLPPLFLPLTSGALLSFARAIGEFGSIVMVAGNIPLRSQTAAVYVFGEIEAQNRAGASAISMVMIGIAFTLILIVDWLQRRRSEHD